MDTLGCGALKESNKAHMTKSISSETVAGEVAPCAKRYDEAFKRQVVEHWLHSGKLGTQIARELGVSYPSLKEWKRRYQGQALPEQTDLAAENRALKAELIRVREQRDILKKTLGILCEPLSNATNGSRR